MRRTTPDREDLVQNPNNYSATFVNSLLPQLETVWTILRSHVVFSENVIISDHVASRCSDSSLSFRLKDVLLGPRTSGSTMSLRSQDRLRSGNS